MAESRGSGRRDTRKPTASTIVGRHHERAPSPGGGGGGGGGGTIATSVRTEGRRAALVLVSCLLQAVAAGAGRKGGGGQIAIITDQDPNGAWVCRGPLSEFAACACDVDGGAKSVACINAQFTDPHVFLHTNHDYPKATSITFHGNNFQDLPSAPLFGSTERPDLEVLNISANYIVNVDARALNGMPNLRVLDLSNNEIVLRPDHLDFLTAVSRLEELYLRRAFTATPNRTTQFELMMQLFYRADLKRLKVLDLSYNFLFSVPYDLACPFPSIRRVDLHQNLLKTLALNMSCLEQVDRLDLSRNHFTELDAKFRKDVADRLPDQSLYIRSAFHCDCQSRDWITWVRKAPQIFDRSSLRCGRASPQRLQGESLLTVPLDELDCTESLVAIDGSASAPVLPPLVVIAILLLSLLLPLPPAQDRLV